MNKKVSSRNTISVFLEYLEKVIIFVLHIILLAWIMYTLYNSGSMTTEVVVKHFVGIGIMGASLIRICAFLAKRRYLGELK